MATPLVGIEPTRALPAEPPRMMRHGPRTTFVGRRPFLHVVVLGSVVGVRPTRDRTCASAKVDRSRFMVRVSLYPVCCSCPLESVLVRLVFSAADSKSGR